MPTYTTGTHAEDWDNSGLLKSLREYLQNGVSEHRNDKVFWAAGQFRDAGYSQADATAVLLARGLADGLSDKEIRKTIDSAYRRPARDPATQTSQTSASSAKSQKPPSSQPDAAALPLPNALADGFRLLLETAFQKGERVSIGRGSRNADGTLAIDYGDVRLREMWLKEVPAQNPEGVFIRINPMAYRGAKNSDVTVYRHVLVEFDAGTKQIQYAALIRSAMPITVIIDSGGRSLHAWIRVDAVDEAQYNERVAVVYAHFQQYSFFDDGNKAPNKWSRLPGATRILYDEANKPVGIGHQKLLAVNIGPAAWDEYEKQTASASPADFAVQTSQQLELMNFKPCQPIIGDWLRAGDIGFVYGARGCGKTWFVDGIAIHASTGKDFDTWRVPEILETLYIDGEMSAISMMERLKGLAPGNSHLQIINHEIYFEKYHRVLNFTDRSQQQKLSQLSDQLKIQLLVFDNLSCLFPGIKENDADEWEKVLPWFLDFRRRRIAIILVHHAGRRGFMRRSSKREDPWIG